MLRSRCTQLQATVATADEATSLSMAWLTIRWYAQVATRPRCEYGNAVIGHQRNGFPHGHVILSHCLLSQIKPFKLDIRRRVLGRRRLNNSGTPDQAARLTLADEMRESARMSTVVDKTSGCKYPTQRCGSCRVYCNARTSVGYASINSSEAYPRFSKLRECSMCWTHQQRDGSWLRIA
jgi:hypothetical protein